MAGEVRSSGRPEENLDGITARCVGEQTAQHDRTQRCGGKPWHPQSLRDVVGVQEGFGDAHRGKAGGIARPPMPRAGLGTGRGDGAAQQPSAGGDHLEHVAQRCGGGDSEVKGQVGC